MLFRDATAADLPTIVALLDDDEHSHGREDPSLPLDPRYAEALAAMDADPDQRLIVAEHYGEIVGTMQITFIPGIAFHGAWRGQIEAVRIARTQRNRGLGGLMIDWGVEQCQARGCRLVQLTSSRDRTDAHRFYEKRGWKKSHYGFKLMLETQ